MNIRNEELNDHDAVYAVNDAAFETNAEADLVDRLRKQAKPNISLVCEQDLKIVGHIMFTPVSLSDAPLAKIMCLAPVAVHPDYQHQGIGCALIEKGLSLCQEMGYGTCVVLGHPDYYPKFGFEPSAKFNIKCEYDVPEDVFMVIELAPDYLNNMKGVIYFHPEFAGV